MVSSHYKGLSLQKAWKFMSAMNRRSFLAAWAALAASPALGAMPSSGEVDIVIVGAGAAGIAAARRVAAAGRRYVLLEASDRIGGRCYTETKTFGVPYDHGAHWLHMPDMNPLVKLAPQARIEVYPAPRSNKVRIGRRNARAGELEDFLAALVRSNRAIADVQRGRADIACQAALPKDLLDWQQTIEFVLGPFGCAKDLNEISALDFARSGERDIDAFSRPGLGALLAKLGEGVSVELSTPVTRIDWKSGIEVETPRGKVRAKAVIVTASTGVLGAGKIKFTPDLPKRQQEAVNQLKLGSYDHVMLELPGNPLGLQPDELVYEKASGRQTAALLANVGKSDLCMIDVAGSFGRSLAQQGEAAMVAFAIEWLVKQYGEDIKKSVKRTHATRWNEAPWVMGAFSAAAVGGSGARKILMEPVRGIHFAGEAMHETLWGTVGGAWESGERAADAALKSFAPTPSKQRQPRRRD
ncbi:MAG: amine oxidase [Xanthobacteraceae bacterium]|nr:amine oxidase [Xanthobacteraceae bacterium]